MRLAVIGLFVALTTVSCTTVTRQRIVDPAHAVALGESAEVVAVNGKHLSGRITNEDAGYVVDGPAGLLVVAPTDSITMDVAYGDEDAIPGEGVVDASKRRRLTKAGLEMVIPGAIMSLVGLVGLAVASPPYCPPSEWCFLQVDARPIFGVIAAVGAVPFVSGAALLIASAATPIKIVPRAVVAPMLSTSTAGGVFGIAF